MSIMNAEVIMIKKVIINAETVTIYAPHGRTNNAEKPPIIINIEGIKIKKLRKSFWKELINR